MRKEYREIDEDELELDEEALWGKFKENNSELASAILHDLEEKGELGSCFNDEILILLAPYLANFSLNRIHFSQCHSLTNKGFEQLLYLDLENLTSLDLSHKPIGAEGFTTLTSLLPLPHLKELNLQNTKIMFFEDKIDATKKKMYLNFFEKLSQCPRLEYLNLSSDNGFRIEIVECFAQYLSSMHVKTLVFNNRIALHYEVVKILQILSSGFRLNRTITAFNMPNGLKLDTNDTYKAINGYIFRNYINEQMPLLFTEDTIDIIFYYTLDDEMMNRLNKRDPVQLNKFFNAYFGNLEDSKDIKRTIRCNIIFNLYCLTHMEVFDSYIKNNRNYLPINEVNLLSLAIEDYATLVMENKPEFFNYYSLLYQHFECVYHILIQRIGSKIVIPSHHVDFEKAEKLIKRFAVVFPQKKYHETIKKQLFVDKLKEMVVNSTEFIDVFGDYQSESASIFNDFYNLNKLINNPDSRPLEKFILEKDIIFKLLDWNHVLSICCDFGDGYLFNLIELLQEKFFDKKTFAILSIEKFVALYNRFEAEDKGISEKNRVLTLRILFPKFLKILLNQTFSLDEYFEITDHCHFLFNNEHQDTLLFKSFIDFIHFKPMKDFSFIPEFINEKVKDLSVLQPLFRVWVEASDRFLFNLFGDKPKDFPLNIFLQFRIKKEHYYPVLKFIQKFHKMSIESISQKRINPIYFFFYESATGLISFFIEMFGVNFIKSMESDVNKSPLPLDQKIRETKHLVYKPSIKQLLEHLKSFQETFSVSDIHTIQKCLSLFSAWEELYSVERFVSRWETSVTCPTLEYFLNENSETKSLDVFLKNTCKSIIKKVDKENFKIKDFQIENALAENKDQWVKIFSASSKLKDNTFLKKIYYQILSLDFLKEGISHFLHTPSQEPIIGNILFVHNQEIRTELGKKNINAHKALEYTKEHHVIIGTERGRVYLQLGYYLETLNKLIQKLDKTLINKNNRLKNLNENLCHVLINIKKNKNNKVNDRYAIRYAMINILPQEKDRLRKIKGYCEGLVTVNSKTLSEQFYPLAQAVKETIALIEQTPEEKSEHKSIENSSFHEFSVGFLSKNDVRIFTLGDLGLGECMSTRDRFDQILLYRIDDAILIPAVIDKRSNLPVALSWLYLAKTQEGEIVLIWDYCEVNNKFSADVYAHIRKIILNELLYFIHQYLMDNPGISGFYMNKLTYSWNKWNGHLDPYPSISLSLKDKLAGSLLSRVNQVELTMIEDTHDNYNLDSIMQTIFHQFDDKILSQERSKDSKEVISIHELITQEIHHFMSTTSSFPALAQITKQLISKNFYLLESFFEKPFENEVLLSLIKCSFIVSSNGSSNVLSQKMTSSRLDLGLVK